MKVGSFIIPKYRLSVLLENLKAINQTIQDENRDSIEKEKIALVIGHLLTSGGFNQKVADMKHFGLLEIVQGRFFLTNTAKDILSDNEIIRKNGIQSSILNIKLWKILWEKFQNEIDFSRLRREIVIITGLDSDSQDHKLTKIADQYLSDISCFTEVKITDNQSISSEPTRIRSYDNFQNSQNRESTSEIVGFIEYPEYSKAPIEIKDALSYQIAEHLLKAMKEKLRKKGVRI